MKSEVKEMLYYEEWGEGGAGLDSIMKSEVKEELD